MVIALSIEKKKGGVKLPYEEMSSNPAGSLVVRLFHLPLCGNIQEDRLIHFCRTVRRLYEPGEVDGGLDMLTSTGSLLDVRDPL